MGGNHGLGSCLSECQRLYIIKSPKVSLYFLFADPGIGPKMTALGSQPVCRLSRPLPCARCWFILAAPSHVTVSLFPHRLLHPP